MESNPFGSFGFKGIVATRQVRTDLGPRQTYLPSTGIAFVTQFKTRRGAIALSSLYICGPVGHPILARPIIMHTELTYQARIPTTSRPSPTKLGTRAPRSLPSTVSEELTSIRIGASN
jgi:hypothetical protein